MSCFSPLIILLLSGIFDGLHSFYVPGVTPHEYAKGDPVEVTAVKMTSTKMQLPYEYYSLSFCRPKEEIVYKPENIGAILRGDRPVNTRFIILMGKSGCFIECPQTNLKETEIQKFIDFIKHDYYVHLLVDNLPTATRYTISGSNEVRYQHGYPIGFQHEGKTYLNNHLRFILKYHTKDGERYRVVGFEVQPMSVKDLSLSSPNSCERLDEKKLADPANWLSLTSGSSQTILFSYEVVWEPSEIRWASRWDIYLENGGGNVHWFSILNSIIIIAFLSTIIAIIFIRALRRDIAKYNRDEEVEDILEESGWKLVHGDVFRPPRYARLLSALIGSGVQLFCMVFIVIFFAMLGMLSPASRGALMSSALFTYAFMGAVAGYFSGRFYKTLRGHLWKSTALGTGMLYPTVVFGIGLVLNFFLLAKGSSAALPFTTMLALFALWWCISVPLIFVGFYFGYRKRPYEQPVRTNQIPRAVPEQKWYHNLLISTLFTGMVPFGAAFIELFYVYTAIWERHFYYLFGFLFIVFIIIAISCAEIAVIVVYFQLCHEDYRWWWRTFITSGGSALYVLGYTVFFYLTKLEITEFVPTVIYFGYSLLVVITFWILTGTIGVYAALIFLQKIYAAIKID